MKWSKVNPVYLEKYQLILDRFFEYLKEDKIKVRIMFRQNTKVPKGLSKKQKGNSYYLLYYQFIKHAFGLEYSNTTEESIYLRTYFDKLPESNVHGKKQKFKNHIYNLQDLRHFRSANIKIRYSDIVDVDSKKHIILQCLDVILGSMAFRLNDLHKIKPEGRSRRGKKTIAKEKMYKAIRKHIVEIYPHFNVGISTGDKGNKANRWHHPYRHWSFQPKEFDLDLTKSKWKAPSKLQTLLRRNVSLHLLRASQIYIVILKIQQERRKKSVDKGKIAHDLGQLFTGYIYKY